MSLPNTITQVQIQKALMECFKKNISIKELNVQENEAGGSYCSEIYSITVKFTMNSDETQSQEIRLVLKDLYEEHTNSSKESFMYETVLPQLNELLGAIQEGGRFSPRCYLTQRNSREQYLFEDLNASGYKIVDRFLGLNEAQTKCVLEKMGQFHAASMIYLEKNPAVADDIKTTYYRTHIDFCEKIINDNVAYISKIVEKWPQFEGIVKKLRQNTGKTFTQKFLNCIEWQDCLVTVITHGDLWIKNILIQENVANNTLDAIFIDFQDCCLGSPGIDFNNFLLTSAQLDVMNSDEKRNALIQHYYESLRKTLVGLNYAEESIPTIQMIEIEFEKSQYFSYYSLLSNFPQALLCEELAKDMNSATFSDDKKMEANREDMFSNERVLATYRYMLPKFDKVGLLDLEF